MVFGVVWVVHRGEMTLIYIVFSGFLAAILAAVITKRLQKYAGWIFAILPAWITFLLIRLVINQKQTAPLTIEIPWAQNLGVSLNFRADGLGLLFALLISGIGALVAIYANEYLKGDQRLPRFYAWFFIFMASMLGVVLSDNLILLFVFWELTSLSSYFLIGFNHDEAASRYAALQALLTTGAGGLAMLAGFILLGQLAGSYEISVLLQQNPLAGNSLYLPILLLILVGAFTKSAQFPFHYWLPNAMQAPTPVSAYLHSATMVKAGIYLLARLLPVLGGTQEWLYLVGGIGGITMLAGGFLAILQTDLKRLLAYTTISALGMIVHLIGLGSTLALKAGMVLLLAHALYKGALFLVAGAVDHECGTRDVRKLGGLRRLMPVTTLAAVLAALSMAGLPPLLGFIAKEAFYEASLEIGLWLAVAALIASVFNVFVAGTVSLETFWGRSRQEFDHVHEAPFGLWLGPVLLGGLGVLFGLWPGLVSSSLIAPAASASLQQELMVKLALWHGINPALILSAVTLALGIGLYLARNGIRQFASRLNWTWGPENLYAKSLNGMTAFAGWQTRILQNGYLHIYLSVVIGTTVLLAGYSLIIRPVKIPPPSLDVRIYELILAGIVIAAIIAAIRSRSRLAAVASVGVVGYGLAVFYLWYGEPDLAMIQFAIETLTVILLVLVIHRFPRFTRLTSPPARVLDFLVAGSAGLLMTFLVLVVTSYPLISKLSPYFVKNSYILAKGRNVVNVILVDFRGIDTLGEITVLSTAALGVYALYRLGKSKEFQSSGEQPGKKRATSLFLRASARLIMPLLLIFSFFLLIRGHNELGGGFTGGVVASAAFMLSAIAFDPGSTRRMIFFKPRQFIGLGLLVALSSGLLSILFGKPFMTGVWMEQAVPVIGKIGTPFMFDVGVYLAVIGVNLHILLNLMED